MKKSLMIFLFALGMCFSLTACNGWSDLFAPSENSSSVAEESSSEENSDSENSSSGANEEERQNVTVTFKQSGQADVVRMLEKGSSLTNVPAPKEKTGYTVLWDRMDFTDINEDLVVNAVETANTYTVTYDANGGTVTPATQEVTYDAAATLTTPTREDYLFNGWIYEGEAVESGAVWTIASDVTLVAEWTDNRPIYTVTFVDGAKSTEIKVKKGEAVSAEDVPAFVGKTGYTAAWDITDYTNITADTTVTADYTANTYTVTYDADGFAVDGATVALTYDAPCSALDMSLETASERIVGWKYGEVVYTKESVWNIAEDVTVTPIWDTKAQATVSFVDTNGSTIDKTLYVGQSLTDIPTPTAKVGYTVDNVWYTDTEYTQVATFTAVEASFTVYAKAVANTYTVTYNANGGAVDSATVEVVFDAPYTLETPTHEDQNMGFAGWVTDANAAVALTGKWEIADNVILTAKWADIRATYTVTFVQAGQPDKTYQVKGGTDLTEIPTPVGKTGYIIEWDVTDFTGISSDITVTAVERAKTCIVTLNANGGGVAQTTITLTYGQAYELPTPVHSNNAFDSWTFNGEKIAMQGIWEMDVDGEITFEAQWGECEWTGSY